MTSPTPWTARDVFKLGPTEWLAYKGLILFFRMSGLWKYPAERSGDLETMTFMDKVYWLYKAGTPIERARRGSGLEEFFAEQQTFEWSLPEGFDERGTLDLSAAGDLMNHPYLGRSRDLYGDIEETLFGADISMANLECVVYSEASGTLSFSPRNGPPLFYRPEDFEAVKGASGRQYAFLATANNHALDFGEAGVDSTLRNLAEHQIHTNGMNARDEDAFGATILEKNAFKVGLISHTFGLNAYQPPRHRPRIVNRCLLNGRAGVADFTQIERQIDYCRKAGVDLVVAQLHWGLEHEFYPTPNQVGVAHLFAEAGVDVLVGHHPHVVQPIEYYRTRREPDRVVPIFYSLGNLVNPFSAPHLRLSYLARMRVSRGKSKDGESKTYVRSATVVPVMQENDDDSLQIRLRFTAGGSCPGASSSW